MQFIDQVKINVRSGKGGNGCSSFRREKFIPRGGPNGGDGGHGGDVVFQGNSGKNTLLDLRYRQHYRAQDGKAGKGKDQHGRNGQTLVIEVPFGTLVRDAATGELMAEVLAETPQPGLKGGRGGKGNARFKTSTNRVPEQWEEGEPGQERWVELELKLMADVGLVGVPNAGKSTLISAVSMARPKIADYPFTTLVPNLGVVPSSHFDSFVMADIPGIIEGAHEGTGLGLRFLRHIERTALLLLLVDASLPPTALLDEYHTLLKEMGLFSPGLLDKPRAVALTKMDLNPPAENLAQATRSLEEAGEQVFPISAVSGAGLDSLLNFLSGAVAVQRAEEKTKGDSSEMEDWGPGAGETGG